MYHYMFEAKIHNTIHLFLVLLIMVVTSACRDQSKVASDGNALLEHPNLVSTAKGMALIKNNLGSSKFCDFLNNAIYLHFDKLHVRSLNLSR